VRPELVAEVKYLTWTDDNLLGRSFTRVCVRKPAAAEVRRPTAGTKRRSALIRTSSRCG
jgi:ATP-dependent DNA ligase